MRWSRNVVRAANTGDTVQMGARTMVPEEISVTCFGGLGGMKQHPRSRLPTRCMIWVLIALFV